MCACAYGGMVCCLHVVDVCAWGVYVRAPEGRGAGLTLGFGNEQRQATLHAHGHECEG